MISQPELTIHGLHYIIENRGVFTRIFWTFLIILSLVSFSYCGYKITLEMFFDVVLLTNIKQVSTHKIPFPAVTICSPLFSTDSAVNISKIIEENSKISDCKSYAANAQKCPLKIINVVAQQCNGLYDLESITKSIENSSMDVKKLIRKCSWRENEVECQKIFNPIVTQNGICYSFNMMGFGSIFNRGIISDEFKSYKR